MIMPCNTAEPAIALYPMAFTPRNLELSDQPAQILHLQMILKPLSREGYPPTCELISRDHFAAS